MSARTALLLSLLILAALYIGLEWILKALLLLAVTVATWVAGAGAAIVYPLLHLALK